MDDLDFRGEVMDKTLREIAAVNKWLGGDNITLQQVKEVINSTESKNTFSIADIGCGSGDILKLLANYAKRKKLLLELKGVDANAYIIEYAKRNTSAYPQINYQQANVFSEEFKKQKFDIISCTLFCHHFDDDTLVRLLTQLKQQSNLAVVVNDLHRHPLAYYFIVAIASVFSKSYMFKYDSKLSVLRAFKKNELEKLLIKAGYSRFSIEWKWAFRYKVIAWSH